MPIVALPESLARAIAAEGARLPSDILIHAAQSLSSSYRRNAEPVPARLGDAERVAYAAVRLPATYGAVSTVLAELRRALPSCDFRTCLDVGAGPGTASLAAHAAFPSLISYAQLERDPGWSELALRLSQAVGLRAERVIGDVAAMPARDHDLVIGAYTLNELPEASLDRAVRTLWAAAGVALVIVEPGTPLGFSVVRRAREICLQLGGQAAAPCTHNALCPMTREDWCHRAVRVQRTALHRQLKVADLGFEDEKFSYIALTRAAPRHQGAARIVRRPIRAGGHVHLDLCAANGLTRTTVGRASRGTYRAAREAEWGELWPLTPSDGGAG